MTGDGGWPMTPGYDEREGSPLYSIPERGCCGSKLNEYHKDNCVNADMNEHWRKMGIIAEPRGGGVATFRLPGGGPGPIYPLGSSAAPAEAVFFEEATDLHAPSRHAAPFSVAEEEPPTYRDLHAVQQAYGHQIEEMADALLRAARDVYGRSFTYGTTYQRVAEFFVSCLLLNIERNEMAHDAWRRVGWAGNLMTLWGKVMRLMYNLWWHPNSEARTEKPLDHMADGALYSAFTAILFQDGDERGAER